VEVTRGDYVPCCAPRGYYRESSVCKRLGESKKNILQRGIPKQPYFAGGNNYLTHKKIKLL
jgi:hypothetical protein